MGQFERESRLGFDGHPEMTFSPLANFWSRHRIRIRTITYHIRMRFR
jgi:hypothetical protein